MAILMVFSVVALAIIFLKLYQFTRLRIGARAFIEEALEKWRLDKPAQALEILETSACPIARVMETAMDGLSDTDRDEEKLREEVLRVSAVQLKSLSANLRGLDQTRHQHEEHEQQKHHIDHGCEAEAPSAQMRGINLHAATLD